MNASNGTAETPTLPLSERPLDWVFIVAFSLFVFSSAASDAMNVLGLLSGDSFVAKGNQNYLASSGDAFMAADHAFVRFTTGLNGFVYGPFYVVLVYAFVKGRNWVRTPALIYVGAMLHGMFEHTYWEYFIGPPPAHPLVFWAFNGPYAVIPFLLGVRMWRPDPFSPRDDN